METIGEWMKLEALFQLVGVETNSFRDLKTSSLVKFNQTTPDHPDVKYFSYGASKPVDQMPYLLRLPHSYIEGREGRNDGLVSVTSANWGEYLGTIAADHYEQVRRTPGHMWGGISAPSDARNR